MLGIMISFGVWRVLSDGLWKFCMVVKRQTDVADSHELCWCIMLKSDNCNCGNHRPKASLKNTFGGVITKWRVKEFIKM